RAHRAQFIGGLTPVWWRRASSAGTGMRFGGSFAKGKPSGTYDVFADEVKGTEPLMNPARAAGRPDRTAQGPGGSIYITRASRERRGAGCTPASIGASSAVPVPRPVATDADGHPASPHYSDLIALIGSIRRARKVGTRVPATSITAVSATPAPHAWPSLGLAPASSGSMLRPAA